MFSRDEIQHACCVSQTCVCVCGCMCVHAHALPQSCWTLCGPMGCSLPGSSVHWIFQARILEWAVISYSRGSSQYRETEPASLTSLVLAGGYFTTEPPGKPFSKPTWMQNLSLEGRIREGLQHLFRNTASRKKSRGGKFRGSDKNELHFKRFLNFTFKILGSQERPLLNDQRQNSFKNVYKTEDKDIHLVCGPFLLLYSR